MKKTNICNGGNCMPHFKKLIKTMKITCLLLLVAIVQVSASTYAQSTKLTLDMKNGKLSELFKEIENSSEFRFFYDSNEIDLSREVTIHSDKSTIAEILSEAFAGTKYSYVLVDRHIIIQNTGSIETTNKELMQQSGIRGKVVDKKGEPLPGVTIVVKGTTRGTISDVDGNFTLSIPDDAKELQVSFVGMVTQNIPIEGKTNFVITMEEETIGLDEVVAVGYGSQRKKDLTGSISSVKADEIMLPSISSFDQMLQGKVAGVQISQTSGSPGGDVNVLIRGVSSITGGNQPLYIVDGYPIGSGGGGSNMTKFSQNTYTSSGMASNTQNRINPLASINPSDIESIEVLKDASATAIYGSRGANGVIIITTKRGSSQKSQINVNISYGVQEVAHKLELLNADQFKAHVIEARNNAWVYAGGNADDPNEVRRADLIIPISFDFPECVTTNTDWQDVIFRIAPVKDYQVSASGGNDKAKYFISGGFFDQKGIILTSNYKRFNLRSNIDAQLSERIKIGSSISGSYGYGRFPKTEGAYGLGGILHAALVASPTIPVYDDEGNYYFNQDVVTDNIGFLANPLSLLEGYSDNRKVGDVLFNNFLEYKILDGLVFKSTVGVKYGTNVIKLWRSSDIPYYTTLNYPATAGVTKSESINWLNENTITFKRRFKEKHSFDALLGFTLQKDSYDQLSAGASNFPTDYVTYLSAGIVNSGTHYVSEWSMVSLISRVNYSYEGKYLLTATLRRDGSSRFGSNHKWGTFPSFSVGYNISEEPFMESVKFISNLKLRFSYGHSGNNQIGNYRQIGLLSTSTYVENNSQSQGVVPSSLSNDDLTWEKSKQTNLGLNLDLFGDRISLVADVYKDHKTDLLLDVNLPAASGFSSSTQNIGEIENKGIEIGLQTINLRKNKFQWSSNFIISANKNKVLKLATPGGRITNSSYQITQEGYPISSFYLLHAIGVFKTSEELVGAALQHPRTMAGDSKFEDVNLDGVINASDKKIVGDPWPDYTWGFENRITYGNLSLSFSLNGSHGADTYWNSGLVRMFGTQNQSIIVEGRWKSEDEPGDGITPRSFKGNQALGDGANTSRLLFDSSFTRIKNINLSYQLPQKLVSKLSLSKLSVYTDIANLYTFTNYPGYDPESSTAGDDIVNAGVDGLTYPLPRTFTLGVNITF